MVFLFSPQCQLVVMLALYTTSHGQSKGPKMVAPGQCRRANGGQKRLAKTTDFQIVFHLYPLFPRVFFDPLPNSLEKVMNLTVLKKYK